jgi:hypothetical protein
MKLTDFIDDVGRPVAYYPAMRHITGSCTATILLCQFVFWRGKEADPEGWLFKTGPEIEEETGLTRPEQETARQKLRERKILKEKKEGIPCKLHYMLDLDRINQLWEEHSIGIKNQEYQQFDGLPQTSQRQASKLVGDKPADLPAASQQTNNIDHAVDYLHKKTTTANQSSSAPASPSKNETPLLHPDLFARCWQGHEADLEQQASIFGDDVWQIADQIDYQKTVERHKTGRKDSPLGLLLMHFRGQFKGGGYTAYKGYSPDWREQMAARKSGATAKINTTSPQPTENVDVIEEQYQSAVGAFCLMSDADEKQLKEEIQQAVEAGEDRRMATIRIVEEFHLKK